MFMVRIGEERIPITLLFMGEGERLRMHLRILI
jgi:hypothetical protein